MSLWRTVVCKDFSSIIKNNTDLNNKKGRQTDNKEVTYYQLNEETNRPNVNVSLYTNILPLISFDVPDFQLHSSLSHILMEIPLIYGKFEKVNCCLKTNIF